MISGHSSISFQMRFMPRRHKYTTFRISELLSVLLWTFAHILNDCHLEKSLPKHIRSPNPSFSPQINTRAVHHIYLHYFGGQQRTKEKKWMGKRVQKGLSVLPREQSSGIMLCLFFLMKWEQRAVVL